VLDHELVEIVDNLRTLGTDGADVEAKRADRQLPPSIRTTLSAFANTRGGVLILGLDESEGFAASGVREPAKMAGDLASWCSTEMEPPLRPLIRVHQIEGASLVVAEIPELEPARKPCFYRGAGLTQGSYVRVADGDRRLTGYEVQMLLAKRGQPRDDEEPVPATGVDDLGPQLVAEFLARLRQSRPYVFGGLDQVAALRRARVLVDGGSGDLVLSLGGLLALGRDPQALFPQLMLTFVHYPTVDGPDPVSGRRFIDNVLLEGPIPVMARDGIAVLLRNMSRRSVVAGVGREDTWEYPEPALREAIVNALVHRDLSPQSRGAQVQIEMYPNRLVVRNPGGLFGPVSVDILGEEGVSAARNATLLQILEDVPIPGGTRTVCENRGSGIPAMIKSLRAARMSPPEFRDRISTFSVTFPNHTLLGTGDRSPQTRLRADRRGQLLAELGTEPVSRADLARRTGLAASTVSYWLRILRSEGLVEPTEKSTRSPTVRYRRSNSDEGSA